MKKIAESVKSMFKSNTETNTKYVLIFMDTTPTVHFVEKQTLNEIYEIITAAQLPVNTYKIIKGVFVNG